ncbi:MAG: alpha/beta fold hydrolase [Spirochaetales bacterium]|nr:alpha/beta fold hydrolase [Spirochaetales bacterium]
MNHIITTFKNNKGQVLSCQYWEDPSKGYEKVIILLHGICYHAGSYPFLVNYLIENRLKVYAFDFQGFGRSPGERGDIEDSDQYVDDLESFRRFVSKREGFREILFLGHSIGALTALAYHLRYPDQEARTICASPLIASPLFDIHDKGKAVIPVDLSYFTKDRVQQERLGADELIVGSLNKRLLKVFAKTTEKISDRFGKLQGLKLLVLHGSFDKLSPVEGVERFFEGLNCKQKKIVTFPRMFHDIFTDKRKEQVFEEIKSWESETRG